MSQVQYIKAAIGKYCSFTRLLSAAYNGGDICTLKYFLCDCLWCCHCNMLINSVGVLLAQPRRRTTSAAAALGRYAASAMLAPAVRARVNVAATVSPAPLVSTISLAGDSG